MKKTVNKTAEKTPISKQSSGETPKYDLKPFEDNNRTVS